MWWLESENVCVCVRVRGWHLFVTACNVKCHQRHWLRLFRNNMVFRHTLRAIAMVNTSKRQTCERTCPCHPPLDLNLNRIAFECFVFQFICSWIIIVALDRIKFATGSVWPGTMKNISSLYLNVYWRNGLRALFTAPRAHTHSQCASYIYEIALAHFWIHIIWYHCFRMECHKYNSHHHGQNGQL